MINYILVPLLIFFVRILDVSLGTIRTIFISRGLRYVSAVIGFFEILIWLFAISQIMHNLTSPIHYIAYALGFSMGNFVGVTIERALSVGNRVVRIITRKDAKELVRVLREKGYGVTSIDAEGSEGAPVKLIFSIVRSNHVPHLIKVIKRFSDNAFFTVEDVKFVTDVQLLPYNNASGNLFKNLFLRMKRK